MDPYTEVNIYVERIEIDDEYNNRIEEMEYMKQHNKEKRYERYLKFK